MTYPDEVITEAVRLAVRYLHDEFLPGKAIKLLDQAGPMVVMGGSLSGLEDAEADDPFAERLEDVDLAWTLGHVIVHVTASSEESAAIAAELARGVKYHGRSRYETPWQSIHTIKQCRERLAESQKIRLASLEMWPADPHLDNEYKTRPGAPAMNAITRFIYGLMHDDDHLQQITNIILQART